MTIRSRFSLSARGLGALATATACFVACGLVSAQAVPDAGSLLKELREQQRERPQEAKPPAVISPLVRPTIRLPDGATVRIARFTISGNSSIATPELAALVASWEGRVLDVAGLNEAASAITRHYQTRGFLLSYAYLPVQKIDHDVVEIAVLEGRVGGVQVVAAQDVRLDDAVVQQHIGITSEGDAAQPARQEDIERRLLLLNDIPGVVARGAFTPGTQPGSADLVVSVVEDVPLANTLYINNHGSQSTGEQRLGAQFHLRDIFGIGDSSRLNLSWSSQLQIANGSFSTRVPLGGNGWQANATISHLTYQLGNEFASLGARGQADMLQLGVTYPMVRSLSRNLGLQADYERKKLRDLIPLIATENQKTSHSLTGKILADSQDSLLGGGRSSGYLAFQAGDLRIDSETADVLGKSGAFGKATLQLEREQSIGPYGQLYARLLSQYASKNLDSSEKFSLAGPLAVRAYGPGDAVDVGQLVTVEYRYVQLLTGATLTWRVFYDYASGRVDHQPLATITDNELTLKGSGLGIDWRTDGDLDVSLTAAWRGERLPSSGGDRKPRLYLQLIKGF